MEPMIVDLVQLLFTVYRFILIIYIFMSWVPNARDTAFGSIMAKFAEPILTPFRKIIPPLGMIDISPIVAFLALMFAEDGAVYLVRMIFSLI